MLTNMNRSACVSAAFRLAGTVQYAEAVDSIYNIGPVCFWAYAEMTCGFIVVCVPCVPKILMESGVWRKMKMGFGLSVTATSKSQTGATTGRSQNVRSVNNSYTEIDETELKDFRSESTEHLRHAPAKVEQGIKRTTQVTVTQSSDIANVNETRYGHQRQWR